MKIAVACNSEGIVGHFGFCEQFAVYEFLGDYTKIESKTMVPAGERGHEKRAALLQGQDAMMVLCDGMGPDARSALLELGIMPVVGYRGDADVGAELLVQGKISITRQSCDSCGGNCGSDGSCGG